MISGPSREEFVFSMGQRSKDAALKDAQIKFKKEECARSMGQSRRSNYAAVMDAQIKLYREECAEGIGQRSTTNFAAVRAAQN